ncbi:MAG: hypothetical protein WDW38_010686 [Sanguina aurantia]
MDLLFPHTLPRLTLGRAAQPLPSRYTPPACTWLRGGADDTLSLSLCPWLSIARSKKLAVVGGGDDGMPSCVRPRSPLARDPPTLCAPLLAAKFAMTLTLRNVAAVTLL